MEGIAGPPLALALSRQGAFSSLTKCSWRFPCYLFQTDIGYGRGAFFSRSFSFLLVSQQPSYLGKRSSRLDALHAFNRSSNSKVGLVCEFSRDRIVEFGKFKGSMMGTLSSSYLRWMVKNLKGGSLLEWAEYAEAVLEDPLYRDRLEWEKVERLLENSHDLAMLSKDRDPLAPARMYGWDLDNDAAWSKVNFSLLGTSKGGKIPRKKVVSEMEKKRPATRKTTARKAQVTIRTSPSASESQQSAGTLRDELDRRRQLRRERVLASRDALLPSKKKQVPEKEDEGLPKRFPGREGLLKSMQVEHPQL